MRRLADTEALAKVLAGGGVALLPTDTLPGLHARADCAAAVARIRQLKGQQAERSLLVLCATIEQALSLAGPLAPRAVAWARRCWPGPFTLVLPRGPGVAIAPAVSPDSATLACRVPALAPLRELVAAAGGPLVSTSANRAGQPPAPDLESAARFFGALVDAVAAGPWPGPPAAGRASALIDVTGWPPLSLREGPLPPPGWDD